MMQANRNNGIDDAINSKIRREERLIQKEGEDIKLKIRPISLRNGVMTCAIEESKTSHYRCNEKYDLKRTEIDDNGQMARTTVYTDYSREKGNNDAIIIAYIGDKLVIKRGNPNVALAKR